MVSGAAAARRGGPTTWTWTTACKGDGRRGQRRRIVAFTRIDVNLRQSFQLRGRGQVALRLTYDKTIEILNRAINRAAIDRSEKVKALRRLSSFYGLSS
jgi:hypothetical protein